MRWGRGGEIPIMGPSRPPSQRLDPVKRDVNQVTQGRTAKNPGVLPRKRNPKNIPVPRPPQMSAPVFLGGSECYPLLETD